MEYLFKVGQHIFWKRSRNWISYTFFAHRLIFFSQNISLNWSIFPEMYRNSVQFFTSFLLLSKLNFSCVSFLINSWNWENRVNSDVLCWEFRWFEILKSTIIELKHSYRDHGPVLGVLVFLPRNFLEFWHFLPRSWPLFLARLARFCKIFQDRGKKSKKIFGLLGKKTKNIQDLGNKWKKSKMLARNSKLSKILARTPSTKTPSTGGGGAFKKTTTKPFKTALLSFQLSPTILVEAEISFSQGLLLNILLKKFLWQIQISIKNVSHQLGKNPDWQAWSEMTVKLYHPTNIVPRLLNEMINSWEEDTMTKTCQS